MSKRRTVAETFAISGLRRKRAYLAGEIERAKRAIAKQRKRLRTLDAALALFDAGIHPADIPTIQGRQRGKYFGPGEQTRLCLDALREASAPLSGTEASTYAMKVKGLDMSDVRLRGAMARQLRWTLHRLAKRGVVRRVDGDVVVRWELAEG